MIETLTPLEQLTAEFAQQRRSLLSYLVALSHDLHLAEDLIQEVWVALAAQFDKGQSIENLPAWCRGVARHLVQKHWREKGKQPLSMDNELLDLMEKAIEESETEAVQQDRQQALRQCLEQLPSASRQMLEMKYDKNYSFAQMAEKLQRSSASLMMAISRLRSKLGECIERRMQGESV